MVTSIRRVLSSYINFRTLCCHCLSRVMRCNNRKVCTFKISTLNRYSLVSEDSPRTSNAVEWWHDCFKSISKSNASKYVETYTLSERYSRCLQTRVAASNPYGGDAQRWKNKRVKKRHFARQIQYTVCRYVVQPTRTNAQQRDHTNIINQIPYARFANDTILL